MEKMEINSQKLVNPSFWLGKKILITGHTGFKGSWLCLWLQLLGAELSGFALKSPTKPALFEEANVAKGMMSFCGDIRNFDAVLDIIEKCQPEIIFHLAAQPIVRQSYKIPIQTYETNVMGTVNVLEAARRVKSVKALINITTDKCYENKEISRGYREDEPMGGHDPYSSSKGCSELITSAYRRSFYKESGIALASARGGNVIGGGDWTTDRLIPDILKSFENNKPVIIRNPNSIRPWQHVLEVLSGYLILAEKLYEDKDLFSSGWNFGPNNEDSKSVKWIVEYMTGKWKKGTEWTLDKENNPHEANYLKLDISKAKSLLGWQPLWTLEQALEKVLEWHKSWVNKEEIKKICYEQIIVYSQKS